MRKAFLCMILACVRPAVAAVLDGRVLEDHNGTPVPRVEILIASPHDAAIVAELETDSQGRFRTPDLPNAEYVLRFSKTNFATFEVTTAPRSGMQMRMVRFGVIDGRIFESDGSPALNLSKDSAIALSPSDVQSGTTDRHSRPGEYHIYGLRPGRYRVAITEASGEGGRVRHGVLFQPNNSQPREFTISGGEEYSNADVTLPGGPAYTVSGKVDLPPPARTVIAAVSAERPGLSLGVGGPRPDGAFSFSDRFPATTNCILHLAWRNQSVRPRTRGGDGSRCGRRSFAGRPNSLRHLDPTLTLRTQEPCNSGVAVDLTP